MTLSIILFHIDIEPKTTKLFNTVALEVVIEVAEIQLAVVVPVKVGLVVVANEAKVDAKDVAFNVIADVINVELTVKLFVVIPLVTANVVAVVVPVNVGLAIVGLAFVAYADSAEVNAYDANDAVVKYVDKVVAKDVPFKIIDGVINDAVTVKVFVVIAAAVVVPKRLGLVNTGLELKLSLIHI